MHALNASATRLSKIADLARSLQTSTNTNPLDRFRQVCRNEGISVRLEAAVSGFYMRHDRGRLIALNPNLPPRHLEFVAFHELGHHFLGNSDSEPLDELEADLFAYLSLRPKEVRYEFR